VASFGTMTEASGVTLVSALWPLVLLLLLHAAGAATIAIASCPSANQ
jgi:hypothetical protein